MNEEQIFYYLIEHDICSYETLDCITAINGFNINTLNDVIYYFTGYRNIEQLKGDIKQ